MDTTLSRLLRYGVGFDHLNNYFETDQPTFPPYNTEQINEDHYRVTLAIAGFTKEDVTIEEHDGKLTVRGSRREPQTENQIIYRGIAFRDFKREWKLEKYIKVLDAKLENGLLTIDLVREIPPEAKPKQISIG